VSDLISRKEMLRSYQELCMNIACSECSFYFGDTLTGDCLLEKWIHSLPSAEPKTPSNGSITCVKSEKMHDRTMGDLISRAEAIDAVEFGITYAKAIDVNTGESKELFKEGNDALKKAVERLKELPSAEPEIIYCGECIHMEPNGKCKAFADSKIRPSASDFCSTGERKEE